MPGPRGRGERRLEDALSALAGALERAPLTWMVVGGIAIIARGVRRMTTDIDAVVAGGSIDARALLELLSTAGIEPRIADAEAFARRNLVLLLRHVATGVDLDVSFGWSSFEQAALARRTRAAYGRTRVPMATAADLVVFKLIAARAKDLEDADSLLLLHPDIDTRRVRHDLAELADLAGAPELVKALDALLASGGNRPRPVRSRSDSRTKSAIAASNSRRKRLPHK